MTEKQRAKRFLVFQNQLQVEQSQWMELHYKMYQGRFYQQLQHQGPGWTFPVSFQSILQSRMTDCKVISLPSPPLAHPEIPTTIPKQKERKKKPVAHRRTTVCTTMTTTTTPTTTTSWKHPRFVYDIPHIWKESFHVYFDLLQIPIRSSKYQ